MSTTMEAMVAAAKAVVHAITAQEVQARLRADQPVAVLDVREKEVYDQGHSAQARLLPRGLSSSASALSSLTNPRRLSSIDAVTVVLPW